MELTWIGWQRSAPHRCSCLKDKKASDRFIAFFLASLIIGTRYLRLRPTFAVAASRKLRRLPLSSAILIFWLVEQINLLPVTELSRSREFAWLSTVLQPPTQCRAFLVDVPSRQAIYLDENDAIWISLRTGLPTLNGNSGWVPYGWRLEDHTIDYFDAARESIAATGLAQTVCLYNRSSRIWSRFGAPN